jgi:hypothetical protein
MIGLTMHNLRYYFGQWGHHCPQVEHCANYCTTYNCIFDMWLLLLLLLRLEESIFHQKRSLMPVQQPFSQKTDEIIT